MVSETHCQYRCAGVDGCRSGWLVASRTGVSVYAAFAAVVDEFDLVGVDMPIGMPPPHPRLADIEARRYISPRGSTIFPTPARACLQADSYAQACAISRTAVGQKISKQAWNILPKIREVDRAVGVESEPFVVEVHPECSFAALSDGRPLSSKHTAFGRQQRLHLLEPIFGSLPKAPDGARTDDVLDAFAVLWSTERFANNTHRTFPATQTQRDQRGLRMRIVT